MLLVYSLLVKLSFKDLSNIELFLISWNVYNEKDRYQGFKLILDSWDMIVYKLVY